jgi:hypothetical protein
MLELADGAKQWQLSNSESDNDLGKYYTLVHEKKMQRLHNDSCLWTSFIQLVCGKGGGPLKIDRQLECSKNQKKRKRTLQGRIINIGL